jgi:branched-subunit amino acid aminotransferase/4-amino-4-deoxychorismate lyase
MANAPTGPDFSKGVAFVGGEYVPVEEARIPLLDWGFLRSDANQDTISVWKGLIFRFDDHLARFKRNINRLRMVPPYDDDARRAIVLKCLRLTGFHNAYVQIIMTRGRPPVGVRDPRLAINQFYVFCIPYMWVATPEKQAEGLHLIVSNIQRIPPTSVDPTVKHYHWLDFEMGLFEAFDRGGETVVLTDGAGNVTEGPGFNIFAVIGGSLITPDVGVLDGITRRTVFELCEETNLKHSEQLLPVDDLRSADEVFLSTTAGGIIPITTIDGAKVGDGKPGPVTWRLRDLYWTKREAGWHGTPVDYSDEGPQP